MKKKKIEHYSDKEALEFHNSNKPGKIEIISSKPMTTKRDLAWLGIQCIKQMKIQKLKILFC